MRTRRAWGFGVVVKGAAAGLVGGLAGAWMMNRFHAMVSWIGGGRGDAEAGAEAGRREQPQHDWSEPATQAAAAAVSRRLFGRELSRAERPAAGTAAHYAFGALSGAVYGAATEVLRPVRAGLGTAYGAAIWLGVDEVLLPVLGLSGPPRKYPVPTHAAAMGSHLVYGLTAEITRRAVRRWLR